LDLAFYRATVEDFQGIPLVGLRSSALSAWQRAIKRAFDLITTALTLLVMGPVMALVALAVRLDSPGPVIFKQQRVGENGRLFWMYKFRSMVDGAEKHQREIQQITEDGKVIYKLREDPRVTRVGRILRCTSLDELPQLINVLKGEMSMVGPRPELPFLAEQYQDWQRQRLVVPPGITGWWQVHGRSDRPMHIYTEDDLYYVQNYSLFLDLRILWKTVWAVLQGRGAY
ncbi:MAG: sugar transferase, partial [Ardenticatenia bacterium]|nr:sugar transferase [Ardenticatenia bacterium]